MDREMQLSPNLQLWEFLEGNAINSQYYNSFWQSLNKTFVKELTILAKNLQKIRDFYKKPLVVTNAFRPNWYDIAKGRSGNSQHCLGKAADFYIQEINLSEIFKEWEPNWGGGFAINKAAGFIHADIRSYPARWSY